MTTTRTQPIYYFDGTPELRTSYDNQRGLAARDLGAAVECIHHAALSEDCFVCRVSGTPLVLVSA